MPYEYTLTVELPATPEEVFDSWLSSEGHTAMTGGTAHIVPEVGASFDAWDGYITGKTLELDADRRIVQTWRTRQFAPDDSDSVIDVSLQPNGDATLLTLKHSNVPDGQTSYEESGWRTHYFEPMRRRFEWLRVARNMSNS